MKISLFAILSSVLGTILAPGQVPSLINFQGRLTDSGGAPVTGNKNFAISVYDAAIGGNLLYTETIGAVSLNANGVYNFQFGAAGTSNTLATETLASTNGTATSFQKILDNTSVISGSVSVTDGTYTWSQSSGSSNEDDFGVAYSTNLRRVTVNYYNGAPATGRTITATYRYGTSGILGALSSGDEHWVVINVDGIPQAARQRVLAVPFACKAITADSAKYLAPNTYDYRPQVFRSSGYCYGLPLPRSLSSSVSMLPTGIISIEKIKIDLDTKIGEVFDLIINRQMGGVTENIFSYKLTGDVVNSGRNRIVIPAKIPIDSNWVYNVTIINGVSGFSGSLFDLVFEVNK